MAYAAKIVCTLVASNLLAFVFYKVRTRAAAQADTIPAIETEPDR
jgi:hypothetical protein